METVWIVLIQLVLLHPVTGCLVNEALNKPASMEPSPSDRNASIAVDGLTDVKGWEPSKNIDTGRGYPAAWWTVDLQKPVQDATVRIFFRTDYTARRNGVTLYTSTTPFSNSSSSSNSPEGDLCNIVKGKEDGSDIHPVYNTTCSGRWRYLLLYTNTNNTDKDGKQFGPTLDFGEVMVLVQGYGTPCTKPCSSRKCVTMTTTCERDWKCPDGCISGWTGEDCTTCDNEHYGPDCNFTCADRKCLHPSSACDNKTGQCVGGCQAGYNGTDCTQPCDNDFYGPDCNFTCADRKCLHPPSACDKKTGQCVDGCQAGYNGTDCTQQCDSGYYGPGCSLSCSDRKCLDPSSECDHVTGQCVDGCQAGYNGTDCRQACDKDKDYGPDCSFKCTDRNCRGPLAVCDHVTGQCDGGCQPGYNGTDCTQACFANVTYGANCEKSCTDRHCMTSSSTSPYCDTKTGQCPDGCELAWRGVDCTSQCPAGTFGSNCTSCSTRHCQGESDCPADGTCSQRCQDGWIGKTCMKECPNGFYGSGCSTRCGSCTSGPACDHVTGNCNGGCRAGWMSDNCNKACDNGSYGLDCTEKCGHCDGVCDSVDGRCSGCLDGYNGTKCDVDLSAASTGEPTTSVVPAAAGAVAALVVIVIVIVVILLIRRRRNSPGRKPNQDFVMPAAFPADDTSRKRSRSPEGNNVYVNVSMDSIPHKGGARASSTKPVIPPKSSREEDDDQSEEMLDEDEAPSSTPYYNIDEEEVIREVAVEDLAATVQKIKRREGGFEAEYNRLPTGFTATYADSQKKENTGKNKFIGYYPYDHNRVRLPLLPDVPGSDYINASIMHNINETKTFIAAQAPKKITLGDFWRMIWEQRCGLVVMLTGLVEDAKSKCYQYWPENDLLTTDHFRITLKNTDTRANYTVRTMKVQQKETGEIRRVAQYHYTTWPDHGVPDTLALVNFIWMMRRTHTRTDGPLLVHCSAGIGRTGTYIAVDSLLDQAREEGKVDVQGYVSIMRGQRKNMIQTTEQYECVFNCLVEMTKYGNTSLTAKDFTRLYNNSGMNAQVEGKTFNELTQLMMSEQTEGAPVRNRMWVDGNQDFIVRTAPSLRSVTGHLLCESPHPGQEKLLWKLVEENNVNNIIVLAKALSDLVGVKGSTTTFGNLLLSTTDQTKVTSDISLSKLLLQEPSNDGKQKVQLLQFNESVSIDSLAASLLEHTILKLMTSELSPRAVVHSSKDRKTGLMFCMFGNLMSEIQEDETVDVLHQVRSFTRSFPDIKLTQGDVKQLFDFARRCAQLSASTYANM